MALQFRHVKWTALKLAQARTTACRTQGENHTHRVEARRQDVQLLSSVRQRSLSNTTHHYDRSKFSRQSKLMFRSPPLDNSTCCHLSPSCRSLGTQLACVALSPIKIQHDTENSTEESTPISNPVVLNCYLTDCVRPYSYTADDIIISQDSTIEMKNRIRLDVCDLERLLGINHKAKETGENFSQITKQTKTTDSLPSESSTSVECNTKNELIDSVDVLVIQSVWKHVLQTAMKELCGTLAEEKHKSCTKDKHTAKSATTPHAINSSKILQATVFCSSGLSNQPNETKLPDENQSNKPSLDQLIKMQDHLTEQLPFIFAKTHDYRIYRQDIILENNFWEKPYTTKGIAPYVMEVAKTRMYAHMKYANVRLHLLKSTYHEKEGCIRIRWRVSGIPQARAFMFWKFLPWRYKKNVNTESEWHDGISTFHLDGSGIISKHQVDRVIPDENPETVKNHDSIKQKLEKLIGVPRGAALPGT